MQSSTQFVEELKEPADKQSALASKIPKNKQKLVLRVIFL